MFFKWLVNVINAMIYRYIYHAIKNGLNRTLGGSTGRICDPQRGSKETQNRSQVGETNDFLLGDFLEISGKYLEIYWKNMGNIWWFMDVLPDLVNVYSLRTGTCHPSLMDKSTNFLCAMASIAMLNWFRDGFGQPCRQWLCICICIYKYIYIYIYVVRNHPLAVKLPNGIW